MRHFGERFPAMVLITLVNTMKIFTIIVRFFLAAVMITYSVAKFTGAQYDIPGEVFDIPLRDIDGITLVFTFLGYSKWFAFLVGFAEAVPALLLLFRRTYLLGAVLLCPMLLFIVLMNIAFGFSTHMIAWTAGLFLLNAILLSTRWKEIADVLRILLR